MSKNPLLLIYETVVKHCYNNPRAKELEPNAKNWRLLLQIDSNEENEMMWGDVGRLYFWIKKDDLLDKNFDKSWFSLQCS